MGYNAAAVDNLAGWLGGLVPEGGAILELGEQQINAELTTEALEAVRRLILKATGSHTAVDELSTRYFVNGPKRIADAFRGGKYIYRCLDVVEGEGVIKADLNNYAVPDEWQGRFDVITNLGTSEHVGNQFNAFRVMHDFARPGATFVHQVPFAGYFNHGLYSYTPAFFIFLAQANDYTIELLDLTPPHMPYTLPTFEGMPNSSQWQGILQQSGLVSVRLRKTSANGFVDFSDYDAHLVGRRPLAEPWASMIANRYDLRVR